MEEKQERKVFKIATGAMPKEQAREYLNDLKKSYTSEKTNKNIWQRFTDWLSNSFFAGGGCGWYY